MNTLTYIIKNQIKNEFIKIHGCKIDLDNEENDIVVWFHIIDSKTLDKLPMRISNSNPDEKRWLINHYQRFLKDTGSNADKIYLALEDLEALHEPTFERLLERHAQAQAQHNKNTCCILHNTCCIS